MARVLTAVVLLPILFAAIWLGGPVYFSALAALGIVLGLVEYYSLTQKVGARSGYVLGLAATAALVAAFYTGRNELIGPILAALVIIELISQLLGNRDLPSTLTGSAATVFGVLYVGLLGGYIIALRVIEDPRPQIPEKLLTLFFIVVFAGDTGAYYTGRLIGRHRLAPRISPAKTVEGAIGGLLGNLLAAFVAHLTFFPELPLKHIAPLSLAMGVGGILGDLCESMLKRGAQTKDASQLIPGHGGLLDRLDSMLFNAPLLYFYYLILLR
ncbi:MAG: phosphatidate cytidylyltransferase [Acidobacteriota bacterium]